MRQLSSFLSIALLAIMLAAFTGKPSLFLDNKPFAGQTFVSGKTKLHIADAPANGLQIKVTVAMDGKAVASATYTKVEAFHANAANIIRMSASKGNKLVIEISGENVASEVFAMNLAH